jgi:hypothetical protein
MRISGTDYGVADRFGIGLRFLVVTAVLMAGGRVYLSQETAIPNPEAVGEYVLFSANRQALPSVVSETGTTRQEVFGGSVRLQADGTSIWLTFYRETINGRVSESESSGRGSYRREGRRIVFQFGSDESGLEGTLDGNTLTIQADVPMVYRKMFDSRPRPPAVPPSPNSLDPPPPPPSPPTNLSPFALSLAPEYRPDSIDQLCDAATLIVEADVQATLDSRQNIRYRLGTELRPTRSRSTFMYLETDAILFVRQVLKGPESTRQVVISQKGGVVGQYRELPIQYDLMRHLIPQAERYILFLSDETLSDLPDVAAIPRYAPVGSWTGLFQIDADRVRVSPDASDAIREQFDGRSLEDVITRIRACSPTQRH